jgi:metal-responsive CopG/Arc/MetJ family transcriptional regulator
MRTTLNLDQDVAAEIERIRRETGVGLSEAVNQLIRRGISADSPRHRYEHRSVNLGLKVDATNIGEVLDALDER